MWTQQFRQIWGVGLVLLLGVATTATTAENVRSKTLVLLDSPQHKSTYSIFLKALEDRGHDLTYSNAFNEHTPLQKFGQFFYDNLVIFSPSAEEFAEGLNVESILAFIDSGRNVLLAGNRNVSEPIRQIATDCGIEFDESQTAVIDHKNYDASDLLAGGEHTLIAANNWVESAVMLGSKQGPSAPVLYSGIGMASSNADVSPLLYRVLWGSPWTYSHQPGARVKDYPQTTGRDTLLVTAVQTRNNGRVLFTGSLEMFSNKFFNSPVEAAGQTYPKSGNEKFCTEIATWTFGGRGILRASRLQHSHQDRPDVMNPLAYRIKDNIQLTVDIEEWDAVQGRWVPFRANDVQIELVMIDPYIRQTLNESSTRPGHYESVIQLPDVYGVYKLVLSYWRLGYSFVDVVEQISVHPFRHDQFERFIDVAFPYYASAFSLMTAFAIFGFIFLYQKDS